LNFFLGESQYSSSSELVLTLCMLAGLGSCPARALRA
jgi:hypothetical protein